MILRARCILPISAPPIENGAIVIAGKHIQAVRPWKDLTPFSAGNVVDLGEVVVLPGFINAHCHLDYTSMAGQLAPPKQFPDWIQNILKLKTRRTCSEFAQSWKTGARMLVESGVTAAANVESVPEILSECRSSTPLQVASFLEMTGVKSRKPPPAILQQAINTIESLSADRGLFGLSPHAPYSTSPELLQLTAAAARAKGWPVTVHLSESAEEFEMFTQCRGPLYDWLQDQRDMADCGRGTPVEHLARNGLLAPNLLAVHANYLGPGDARNLAEAGASVVHCPRSHAFFGHQPFPLPELISAGVNVCLGTDSLASISQNGARPLTLNMFEEMQVLSRKLPGLPPATILLMATAHGARALGWGNATGLLQERALANFIAIPFKDSPRQAAEAVLWFPGPVSASMIEGHWAIPPSQKTHSAHERI